MSLSIDENIKYVIEAENLRKSFGSNHVLDGVSFKLCHKENLVVLGRSGTGKSVLLKCISGLVAPDSGSLKVLGHDILKLSNDDWVDMRKEIGFLFQGGALYDSMSVRENLEFPLKRQKKKFSKQEMDAAVEEVLVSVGLLDAINKMPAELSGGMQKRIALARTLILKPKLMLYDEPTTGLDPITSQEISRLILKMRDMYNVSSLIITHDMTCTRMVGDKIFILKDGKFEIQGTYQELLNHEDEWVRSFFN